MKALQDLANRLDKFAFLIGNGPNLASDIMPKWKDLLVSISENPILYSIQGLSNTEVYDLVELYNRYINVKEKVQEKLELLPTHNTKIHKTLMEFAKTHDVPVLTTNFDQALENSINAKVHHIDSKGFTRFYPWKTYYGFQQHMLPTDGFGIWKIHGDVKYKDSIRLGLTDYIGSAERARKLIHQGDDRLFYGKKKDYWKGHQTWLHIWFNLPIVIFGFGFGVDEVFLRWLLIERKRYLNSYYEPMKVFYIAHGDILPAISNLMQNLDVEIIKIDDYSELYGI